MAEQLLLVRTYDFEADQDSVSLLTRTVDGFEPAYQGWTPRVNPKRGDMVEEAITLRVQGASTDAIATSLQKLADKAEDTARYFANGARDYAVWFRVQLSGETKGRQSLVYELRHEPASSVYDVSLRASYHWNKYTVGITRAPWWEGTAAGTITGGTINALGGTITFGSVNGTLPSRIAEVKIDNVGTVSGAWVYPFGQTWIGVRSNRYGTAGSFVPYWSLGAPLDPYSASLSGIVPGVSIEQTDASTKGGTRSLFQSADFVEYDWRYVRGLTTSAVITNPTYLYGDHLVLLRARMTGNGTALVQLQTAFSGDSYLVSGIDLGTRVFPNARVYPSVAITATSTNYGTAWHLYEIGRITIPETNRAKSQQDYQRWGLFLYAQGVSGSPDIYFDGFFLVPQEGFVWSGNPERYDQSNSATATAWAINAPDGVQQSYTTADNLGVAGFGSAVVYAAGNPNFAGGMPVGDGGKIFVFSDRNAGGTISATVNVRIKYFERWDALRGND